MWLFCFKQYGDHRHLHVLTHSFPTRRSSDLRLARLQTVMAAWDDATEQFDQWREAEQKKGNKVDPDEAWQKFWNDYRIEKGLGPAIRSEEHTSELQSLMRISYAVFCLTKKKYSQNLSQPIHADD